MADAALTGKAPARTDAMAGPRGAKPKRILSGRNIMIYGTLIVFSLYYLLPLWVMVMTSLKGMPEVRLGNIFAPPVEITFSLGSRLGPRPAPA
jgi:glucose/mannose transport system permease protein